MGADGDGFDETNLSIIESIESNTKLIGVAYWEDPETKQLRSFKKILKMHYDALKKRYGATPQYLIANFATLEQILLSTGTSTVDEARYTSKDHTVHVMTLKKRKKEQTNGLSFYNITDGSGGGDSASSGIPSMEAQLAQFPSTNETEPQKRTRQGIATKEPRHPPKLSPRANVTSNTIPFVEIVGEAEFLYNHYLHTYNLSEINQNSFQITMDEIFLPNYAKEIEFPTIGGISENGAFLAPSFDMADAIVSEPREVIREQETISPPLCNGDGFQAIREMIIECHRDGIMYLENFAQSLQEKDWPRGFSESEQKNFNEIIFPFFYMFVEALRNENENEYLDVIGKIQPDYLGWPPLSHNNRAVIAPVIISINEMIRKLSEEVKLYPFLRIVSPNWCCDQEIFGMIIDVFRLWKTFLQYGYTARCPLDIFESCRGTAAVTAAATAHTSSLNSEK